MTNPNNTKPGKKEVSCCATPMRLLGGGEAHKKRGYQKEAAGQGMREARGCGSTLQQKGTITNSAPTLQQKGTITNSAPSA